METMHFGAGLCCFHLMFSFFLRIILASIRPLQASYLRVQSQQLRTKADHWATEQANIAKWRQSAIEEAKIMDQNYAALIQARHTRQVGLELASEALKAKKEALEATLEVYTTTNVLLEAMEARASWLREVFGARFHWLNQVLSEVDLEGLEDYLSVAREQLKWVQTLCNRKARDLSHLSSRLEQHTQVKRWFGRQGYQKLSKRGTEKNQVLSESRSNKLVQSCV